MILPRIGCAFVLAASLGFGRSAYAQTSFARVPELTGSGPGVGISVDSVGLLSTPMGRTSGSVLVQVPPGSSITAATLFTFVRFRTTSVDAPPTPLPGEVRLAGQPVINGGAPRPAVFPAVGGVRCGPVLPGVRECFATLRSDVTRIVSSTLATPMPPSALSLEETGDSVLSAGIITDLFVYEGHALVVRYRAEASRTRFVGVWAGTEGDGPVSLTDLISLPPMAACPAGTQPDRDERVTVSATITSTETGCEGSNGLGFLLPPARTVSWMGVGGSDDGDRSVIGELACLVTGRGIELRALITTGSFGGRATSGAGLLGRAIGLDGDELSPGPAGMRLNDELSTLEGMPFSARLTSTNPLDRTPRSLGMIAVQYPVDGDSDGDGHSDLDEGVCARTNTDNDRAGLEDFLDLDSDDDCIPDVEERGPARITVDLARSDEFCRRQSERTPVCEPNTGMCVACRLACDGMNEGTSCLRVPGSPAGFRCGCRRDSDCLDARTCDEASGTCKRATADGGIAMDSGGALDGSPSQDDASAARDDAGDVSPRTDGGTMEEGGASRSPRFGGGACGCTAPSAAPAGAAHALLAGVTLLMMRRRRRAR